MEIDGFKVAHNTINWKGRKVGNLTPAYIVGRHPTRRTLIWFCECDCGGSTQVTSAELSAEDTKSCGCERYSKVKELNFVHGYSGTKEHKAWKRIKQRCLNKNSKEYEIYSKIGMSENFAKDFMVFYQDIGKVPDDFQGRLSVDRIDNTRGYVEGNVRWANDEQQSRNKGKYSNNKTGTTGVYYSINKSNGHEIYTVTWRENKKAKSKSFFVSKYGDELAFFLACEYRDLMIQRLNLAGAGYTENHGK